MRDIPLSFLIFNVRDINQNIFISEINNLSKIELNELSKYASNFEQKESFEEYAIKECHETINYFHLNDISNYIFSIFYSNFVNISNVTGFSEIRVSILVDSLRFKSITQSESYLQIKKKIYEMIQKENKLKDEKLEEFQSKRTILIKKIQNETINFIKTLVISDHKELLEKVENIKNLKDLMDILDFLVEEGTMDYYKKNEFWELFYIECDPKNLPMLRNIRNDLFLDLENVETDESDKYQDIVAM